jgi:hypothetical protein
VVVDAKALGFAKRSKTKEIRQRGKQEAHFLAEVRDSLHFKIMKGPKLRALVNK